MHKSKPPKADMRRTVDSFFVDDRPPLNVVDRSTLERYAECPAQARLIETGAIMDRSAIMEAGNEVHAAFSETIGDYIASQNNMTPGDVQDAARGYLYGSRPDLQPDAVRGARASLYHWSRYLAGIHFENILAYDGGKGERSGQLAFDFADLRLRITSELDLLHAGPSPELLHETDYKSGHKFYSTSMVADSFQFQLHALLVFENFPGPAALSITVWNSRSNRRTFPVEFRRDDKAQYLHRVRKAAEIYARHRDDIPALTPTWPTVEKCKRCQAAALCPATGDDRLLVEWAPAAFVDETTALAAKVEARLALMASYVKRTGQELRGTGGNAFGVKKPKKREAGPKPALYQVKESEPEETDHESDE